MLENFKLDFWRTYFFNYFVIIAHERLFRVPQARATELMSSRNQWLFVVSDSNDLDDNMTPFLDEVADGDNVAFMYNTSASNPPDDCQVSVIESK